MPSIIIKADEFKYPTRDEIKKLKLERPRLNTFGFPYVYEMIELLDRINGMADVARRSHLHWWDHCLANRLGSLNHAYITALVHYNRGLPDDIKDYQYEHFVNRTQFSYYGETYFYFFISVRDTIAQLINVYFSMGISENKLFINEEFYKKIPDQNVKNLFVQFMTDTKLTSEFRNGLAHRFLLTQPDYRPSINYDKGMVYEAGAGNSIRSSELNAEIKRSFLCIAKFLDNLRPLMK
jgi:phage pi2 protein 07